MSFFKVERGWQDSEVWDSEPYSQREAWLWLVAEANFKDSKINVDNKPFLLKRGQLRVSIRFMAEKFQWSKDRVARYMERLANWGMIATETATGQTVITICNYSKYQDNKDATKDTNKDGTKDTTKDKLEEGKEGSSKDIKQPAKISSEDLTIDHIADWLNRKRVQGKFLTVDEAAQVEYFKDYCRSKNPKYADYIAALRKSFSWDNVQKKGQPRNENPSRQPTKSERLRIAGQQALDELNAATDAKHGPEEKLAIAGPSDAEL